MLTPWNIRCSPTEIAHVLGGSGSRVLLVDDTFAPQDETGEVCVRGGHVMQGYWNRTRPPRDELRERYV